MKYVIMLIALITFYSCSSPNSNKVQVNTQSGIIEGVYDTTNNVYKYLGVPYAKPPVGNLRWKAPQTMEPWQGVKETKKFGNSPVQINVYGDMVYRSDTISEDCLYLNVWVPKEKSDEPFPVLVYFYGGGYLAGCGSEGRYDGATMAKKGIIAITVNYRLNIFGFFSHPELSKESEYGASGNYGLIDQAFALKWVKDNITAFGGNANKITIAGESAGSISVSSHMASPLSKHLISGAIGQSGAAVNPTLAPVSKDSAEQLSIDFMKKAGYSNFTEFRKLNTRQLFDLYLKSDNFRFPTIVDGYFFTKSLPEVFSAGEQAQVPLMAGWTSAELPGMIFMQGLSYSKENFINKVKEAYPENFAEVLELYPHNTEKEIEQSATQLTSDRFIVYSTWKWLQLHNINSEQPVYRYLFSQIRPGNDDFKPIGASHASDIEYFMGNLHLNKVINYTSDDYKVANEVSEFVANFVKTGNPNGLNLPEWKTFDASIDDAWLMNIHKNSLLEKAKNDNRFYFHDGFYIK